MAQSNLAIDLSEDQVAHLVRTICTAARSGETDALIDEAKSIPATTEAELKDALTALGRGAQIYCPGDVAEAPELLNTVYAAAAPAFATSMSVTTTVAVTTAAPAAAAPRATAPTTTAPTATDAPSGAYYATCTDAKNAGVAPLHQGDPGYRSALDRDHDGVACE
jgi:hypothetical protein